MKGTRVQQKTNKTLSDKQLLLKKKYETFRRCVDGYNKDYAQENPIACLTLDEVRKLSLSDSFWDIGQLTHPTEAWAVDPKTQDGIKALRERCHAKDELRRLTRECRQSIKWAVCMEEKLSLLDTCLQLESEWTYSRTSEHHPAEVQLINLVFHFQMMIPSW